MTLPESGVTCVRVFTASVRLVYRGKVQCSDTLRTGADQKRRDHLMRLRSGQMGSDQVRSGHVRYTQCYACSALLLHYIQCIMYQCRERVQQCMCARSDEIRPDETGPITWKSGQMGWGQVKSGQVRRSRCTDTYAHALHPED